MMNSAIAYLRRAAENTPDRTAFSDNRMTLSYARLWEGTCAAAAAISRRLNGQRRAPVFVCIDRTVDSVLAFFGAAASGNFYVPVDPALPDSRLERMARVIRPALVILTGTDTRSLPFGDVPTVCLPELLAEGGDSALVDWIEREILDVDPLYCMFTSGSTGTPKGVLVSHRSVIDLAEQFTDIFGLDGDCVFGNQAPFDFDVSVKDIYLSVKNGAQVHILEKSLFSQPARLVERMEAHGVNTVIWSVSAMKLLSALRTFDKCSLPSLRLVMFSGEALPCKVLNDWREHLPQARFVNLYGPTEITCNCTYYKVERPFADNERLPIGRAFPNCDVFLMDGDEPVSAPGQTGEICVSGSCLALGYYGNPEQTGSAFCPDPRYTGWTRPMYRTGDLGAWDGDGQLLFLGRGDSQVKYMGFRIELGEIETAVNAVDFVTSACCLFDHVKEQLCLFYQSEERDDRGLVLALRRTLPKHLVPTRLYWFGHLPENRTGKIDRAALRRDYIESTGGQ